MRLFASALSVKPFNTFSKIPREIRLTAVRRRNASFRTGIRVWWIDVWHKRALEPKTRQVGQGELTRIKLALSLAAGA